MKCMIFSFQFLCALAATTVPFLSYSSSEQADFQIEEFRQLDPLSFLEALSERTLSQNEINQLLFVAIKRKSLELTENLIEKNADVNARDKNGFTPLFTATINDAYECANKLVEEGAQLGSSNRWANIFIAIIKQEAEKVETLLQGTNIHESEQFGFSLLHAAAYVGHSNYIDILLKNGASVNRKDSDGNTPLHIALQQEHISCIKSLIHHGASVHILDGNRNHPLYYPLCVFGGTTGSIQLHVIRTLLAHGANPDTCIHGMKPLHISAKEGKIEMFRCLVDAGANINALDDEGLTPLLHAVKENKLAAVKCLVTLGADVQAADSNGCTPLHYAANLESTQIIDYLLDHNAQKNTQDNCHETPLDKALLNRKNAAAVIALLLQGSKLNLQLAEVLLCTRPDRFIEELLLGIHVFLSRTDTRFNRLKSFFHRLAQVKLSKIAHKNEWLKTGVGKAWHLIHNVTSPFYQNDYHHTADPLTEIKIVQTMLCDKLPNDCVREIFELTPLTWQTIVRQEGPERRDQGTNTESENHTAAHQPTKRNTEDNNSNPRPNKRHRKE